MQTDHKTNGGRGASLSRRNFLQVAKLATCSAGLAAAVPAAAEAGGSANLRTLPLSDGQQLEACIEELKTILRRMDPFADEVAAGYTAHEAGGGGVLVSVRRRYCGWNGPGFYEVFEAGFVRTYWIDRHVSKADSRVELWGAIAWGEHLAAPRTLIRERDLVRKLEGGAA